MGAILSFAINLPLWWGCHPSLWPGRWNLCPRVVLAAYFCPSELCTIPLLSLTSKGPVSSHQDWSSSSDWATTRSWGFQPASRWVSPRLHRWLDSNNSPGHRCTAGWTQAAWNSTSGNNILIALHWRNRGTPGGGALPLWESVGMRPGYAPHFRQLDDLFAPLNLTMSTILFRSCWVPFRNPPFSACRRSFCPQNWPNL